ncbi:MAG TPA: maleylpyruvate isomerase N-terminal domain-containing protein [Terriglobales bacterium]|nr:maleylpyruvate isomerase N-terminal domain-containing protein [Terriglobales bacterium]
MSAPTPNPPAPIQTAHLFPKLEALLLELLESLSPDDWLRPTLAPKWTVKDVAAHLLDTELRLLSMARDGYRREQPAIASNADLVAFVNRLNAEGVAVLGRLSPAVLVSLLRAASPQLCAYVASLDPFAPAAFGVSWAGEQQSANWFDTAREYTERWHHQQQIRLATNKPGAMTRELYFPVLDCFMRALPFAYRDVPVPAGTLVQVNVSGDAGGTWYLHRAPDAWKLLASAAGTKAAEVTIPQEIAWRIFTKGIDRQSATQQMRFEGDAALGRPLLRAIAIVG